MLIFVFCCLFFIFFLFFFSCFYILGFVVSFSGKLLSSPCVTPDLHHTVPTWHWSFDTNSTSVIRHMHGVLCLNVAGCPTRVPYKYYSPIPTAHYYHDSAWFTVSDFTTTDWNTGHYRQFYISTSGVYTYSHTGMCPGNGIASSDTLWNTLDDREHMREHLFL